MSDVSHRIRFMYTPKHTSWLNQIELWFSILVRRLLKRGNFTSVEDLRERILAFIAYFNPIFASWRLLNQNNSLRYWGKGSFTSLT